MGIWCYYYKYSVLSAILTLFQKKSVMKQESIGNIGGTPIRISQAIDTKITDLYKKKGFSIKI